jgi:tRNA pseudouridine-54 N-methylase
MTENSGVLRFIQLLPDTPPTTNFSSKDLPGSGKRIDILCRVLAAGFDWSPSIIAKTKIEVMAVFSNEVALTVSDPRDDMPVGEVAWVNAILEALRDNPPEYIKIESIELQEILDRLLHEIGSRIVALDEKGDPIVPTFFENKNAQNSFMLGDHRGFDSESLRIIRNKDIQQRSLGEKSYLSSHCVAALISKFERFGS